MPSALIGPQGGTVGPGGGTVGPNTATTANAKLRRVRQGTRLGAQQGT